MILPRFRYLTPRINTVCSPHRLSGNGQLSIMVYSLKYVNVCRSLLLYVLYVISECDADPFIMRPLDNPVTIMSPNYPHYYFDNIDCTWLFRAADNNGSYVIEILDMLLFSLRGYDDLRIGRGYNRSGSSGQLLRLTHHVPPGTVVVVDHRFIWIWFYTDYDYRQRGFTANISRTYNLGKHGKLHISFALKLFTVT